MSFVEFSSRLKREAEDMVEAERSVFWESHVDMLVLWRMWVSDSGWWYALGGSAAHGEDRMVGCG